MRELFKTAGIVCLLVSTVFFCAGCSGTAETGKPEVQEKQTDGKKTEGREMIDNIAREYVILCFRLGFHDKSFVDAYFGPEDLELRAKTGNFTLEQIINLADGLLGQLDGEPVSIYLEAGDQMAKLRHRYLKRMLQALKARAELVSGKKMSFDAESEALYDAVAPVYDDTHYETILAKLEEKLPGKGTLEERFNGYRKRFIIPREKLEAVFNAAIDEGRKRTKDHLPLPANESFTVEYVKDKSWGAYNWFKGNANSLIQVNTDLPVYIDRAVDLACHEGYPGHHIYYTLIEETFYKKNGWVEFSIYPIFSPVSLIAEGTANYGIEVAFPHDERMAFEKNVLFPMAGLNPDEAENYYEILKLQAGLSFAGNDVGRRFLDGKISKEEAVRQLMKFQLRTRPRAEKYLSFIQHYRTYIVNYNLGYRMVKAYIEKKTGGDKTKRWDRFIKLMSAPLLPSDLE